MCVGLLDVLISSADLINKRIFRLFATTLSPCISPVSALVCNALTPRRIYCNSACLTQLHEHVYLCLTLSPGEAVDFVVAEDM